MRVLLDECVPAPLARPLSGFQCSTVDQMGWKGIQNGSLMRLAEQEFDLFLTADQSVRHQQNLLEFNILVVELSTNDMRRLRGAVNEIRAALANARANSLTRIEIS